MKGVIQSRIIMALPIFLLVLASGCVSLDIEQTINSDGWSDIKLTLDMSAMYESMESMSGGLGAQAGDIEEVFATYCDNFLGNTTFSSPYCIPVPSEYKIVSGGRMYIGDNPSFTVKEGFMSKVYRYDLKMVQSIASQNSEYQGQEITESQVEQAKTMSDLMGMNFNYELTMPGKITETTVGEIIDDNKVRIDLFDIYTTSEAYVESEETSISFLGLFVMAGCIIIVIMVVIIIVMKSRKSNPRHYKESY